MANVVNDKIMSDKQLLTVAEVARVYGFSVQKVYRFIKKGELSKDSAGKISLSECLRVFGAIPSETGIKQSLNDNVKQSGDDVIALLKQQIAALEGAVTELKGENKELKFDAKELRAEFLARENRLLAILENKSGSGVVADRAGGGLFSKFFK